MPHTGRRRDHPHLAAEELGERGRLDADLLSTPRHHVGRRAVEANHGQQGRQQAKEAGLEFLYKALRTGEDRRLDFLVS